MLLLLLLTHDSTFHFHSDGHGHDGLHGPVGQDGWQHQVPHDVCVQQEEECDGVGHQSGCCQSDLLRSSKVSRSRSYHQGGLSETNIYCKVFILQYCTYIKTVWTFTGQLKLNDIHISVPKSSSRWRVCPCGPGCTSWHQESPNSHPSTWDEEKSE